METNDFSNVTSSEGDDTDLVLSDQDSSEETIIGVCQNKKINYTNT